MCEFENIEHGIICGFCVNPKEYFELYGIFYETSKKHKGEKVLSERILIITPAVFYVSMTLEKVQIALLKKINRHGLKIKKDNMYMVTTGKSEFGQVNDKRYIFCDGIFSLPHGHKDLKSIAEFKESLLLTLQDLIRYHENNFLRFEQNILQGNERMAIINSVLTQ